MKDGSMFSSLEKYKSKEFVKEHPIIQFDTITQEREYEVIGAFYSKIDEEENTFKYYNYNDLSNINIFNEFISNVKNNSIYDTGVEAIYGDITQSDLIPQASLNATPYRLYPHREN